MRKRGRKPKDIVDNDLSSNRRSIRRACKYVEVVKNNLPADELVLEILARELEVLKSRSLMEIREAPFPQTDYTIDEEDVNGSPVCARLIIPQLSVLNCLNNSMRQITHATEYETSNFCFTPESHVLVSKACELFIIECASRAFIDSVRDCHSLCIKAENLTISTKSAWRAALHERAGNCSSYDFLEDIIIDAGNTPDAIDKVIGIHRRN